MQTDCRGGALVQLLALIDAVTAAPADGAAAGPGPAPSAGGEAPAAALARALQSALGSSYLKKLQELADSDSSSGGGGRKPEGLLAVFSPALGTAPQLLRFLGPAAEAQVAAAASTASPQEQQAALQRLLAAAVPAAVWQRCSASSLRVCWVAADAAAAGGGEQPLPALPALHAAMRQHCSRAAAAPLARLAGECAPAEFAALLALPQRAAAEVRQAEASEAGGEEDEEECWPAAADGSQEGAMEHLKLLLAGLEGHKGEGVGMHGRGECGGCRAGGVLGLWRAHVAQWRCLLACALPCMHSWQHASGSFALLCWLRLHCPLTTLLPATVPQTARPTKPSGGHWPSTSS